MATSPEESPCPEAFVELAHGLAERAREIVVAGVCIPRDHVHPTYGIFKHLSLKFVLGWTPKEFSAALHHLADGDVDGQRMVTGEVGLDATPQAFADLADPGHHVKIVVRPDL